MLRTLVVRFVGSLLTSAEFELRVETNRPSGHVEVLERQPILIESTVVAPARKVQGIRNQIPRLRIHNYRICAGELPRLRPADAVCDGLPGLVDSRLAAIVVEQIRDVEAVRYSAVFVLEI